MFQQLLYGYVWKKSTYKRVLNIYRKLFPIFQTKTSFCVVSQNLWQFSSEWGEQVPVLTKKLSDNRISPLAFGQQSSTGKA